MDSRFNNGDPPPTVPKAPSPDAVVPDNAPLTPAVQKFHGCRWRQAAEDGVPEHCTHRDVLPMTGTTGFDPEAWCPDCAYYKAKRTPRKREERRDDYWRQ